MIFSFILIAIVAYIVLNMLFRFSINNMDNISIITDEELDNFIFNRHGRINQIYGRRKERLPS